MRLAVVFGRGTRVRVRHLATHDTTAWHASHFLYDSASIFSTDLFARLAIATAGR